MFSRNYKVLTPEMERFYDSGNVNRVVNDFFVNNDYDRFRSANL